MLFAKFAVPGMCNPADDEPCVSGTPTQAQIDHDQRSPAQRHHDALLVIGRIALMTDLGQLNGLPVSVIIRTTLADLESRAGIGISGAGTTIPIRDVIRMGGHAHWHLAVFDQATGAALNYFRARRTASPAQRFMLIARDGGCTKPGCTVGPYGCQAHHAVTDWAQGGNTNVDEMALACGPDNRLVHADGGYTTSINADGDVEWQPPPDLEHGQHRINYHHRPELLLTPPQQPPAPEPQCKPESEQQQPEPEWVPEQTPEPQPEYDPEYDSAHDPEQHPDWDPQGDRYADPDWDPDWDSAWETEWDLNPTPTPPNIEHLWDTEPFDPQLPPGWTLLDPHTGKPTRGP